MRLIIKGVNLGRKDTVVIGNSEWWNDYLWTMQAIESIKDILVKNKPYLVSKYSLSSIGVFGAVLQDDFAGGTAVEIIVDFKKPIGIEIVDLGDELETLIQHKVDLVTRNGIEKSYYNLFRKEIQYI